MSDYELIHHIALTLIPHVGSVHAHLLMNQFSSPQEIFQAPVSLLRGIPGIGEQRANAIKQFNRFDSIEKELKSLGELGIQVLVRGGSTYPNRLAHAMDAPHVLYFKGNANLNAERIVGIVGTRLPTDYGRHITRELIRSLAPAGCVVVSGLAYGVDTCAHSESLDHHLHTIGVLGHGLDTLYPHVNRRLAARMIEQGGLLTEFQRGTSPDRQNFPKRNRIVAALCDALVIVESGDKGGSIITASIANSYNKDVFAVPGRVSDPKSEGCNSLIREHKAYLITSGNDLLHAMGWESVTRTATITQRGLFIDLEGQEKVVYDAIVSNEPVSIDGIAAICGLRTHQTAAVLLSLELQGLVASRPGKMYGTVMR